MPGYKFLYTKRKVQLAATENISLLRKTHSGLSESNTCKSRDTKLRKYASCFDNGLTFNLANFAKLRASGKLSVSERQIYKKEGREGGREKEKGRREGGRERKTAWSKRDRDR